ncbi:MAG TPA: hypothetical protein VF681_04420 [Abditibacteriaceae bacterium]|jgi:hypothetical protein
MKKQLCFLATIAFAAISTRAVVAAETNPTVDPKALNTLARMSEKYRLAPYYRGVTDLQISFGKGMQSSARIKVAVTRQGQGSVTVTSKQGTETWVSDGKQLLATASRGPKQYITQPLAATENWRLKREVFLAHAGLLGALPELLSERIGQLLLDPALRSVKIVPTREAGATQKIEIRLAPDNKKRWFQNVLFIGPDLTLRRYEVEENSAGKSTVVWSERHSQISLAAPPASFATAISTVPPSGFSRVETFDSAGEKTLETE